MGIDTQIIRNAYMARPAEHIYQTFGDFACKFLNVDDKGLSQLQHVGAACNYILVNKLNEEPLEWPSILCEQHATTNVVE